VRPFSSRALPLLITVAGALWGLAVPGAQAASCTYPRAYPGDGAAKEAIASWMAGGAIEAGLPGELPVMASLTDAGLTNLPQGDADGVGYFRMRVAVWNNGDYAGFPDQPPLQLQWFIDQAQAARQRAVAAGNTAYGVDSSTWGAWAADVQRPAEQYRGRYQLRLDDARSLTAAGCVPKDPDQRASPPPAASDPSSPPAQQPDALLIAGSVLPQLAVRAKRYQDAAESGALAVTAACSNETCLVRAGASVAVPNRGVFRMSLPPVQLARGERRTFRLTFTSRLRKLVTAALRKRACALGAMRIIAANAGGYRNSASRTVFLGRSARACR
jgi:hypothetical protein